MSHYYFDNKPHGMRKNGTKINTKLHHDYISRKANYAQIKGREGEKMVYTASGNLPSWAKDATDFWEKAEKYRNPGGRAYREFKFALQEELTLEENIDCIKRLIDETGIGKNHAYSFAVHDKVAAFDKDHRNIHCHLMFNEKIIERDRPLNAEKYFKNYAKTKDGRITGGYRSSREFITKEKTFELRKLYAKIINDKFREKGLDCTVDERTLKAQYIDLLKQGKTDEAELVNRMPSPHLGNAYKNPATMQKIMIKITNTDEEATACSEGYVAPDEDLKNTSIQDKKIALFANDVVIRRVIKEIKKERLLMRKAQLEAKAKVEAMTIEQEPIVITTGEVCYYLENKLQSKEQEALAALKNYKVLKATVLTEKQIIEQAKDRLCNNRYLKDISDYRHLAKKLDKLQSDMKATYGVLGKENMLANYAKQIQQTKKQQQIIGRRIASYKSIIKNQPQRYNNILNSIRNENECKLSESKKLYAKHCYVQNLVDKYKNTIEKLKNYDPNDVLFIEKMPEKLHHKSKLNGDIPLTKFPNIIYKKDVYAIIEPLPKDKVQNNFLKAVKFGDDIKKGRTPAYVITLDKNSALKNIKQIDEMIYLYKQNKKTNIINLNQNEHRLEQSSIEKARYNHNQNISNKVSAIAEKLINSNNQKLHANWQENDISKDKIKQAEKNIYSGWSL